MGIDLSWILYLALAIHILLAGILALAAFLVVRLLRPQIRAILAKRMQARRPRRTGEHRAVSYQTGQA